MENHLWSFTLWIAKGTNLYILIEFDLGFSTKIKVVCPICSWLYVHTVVWTAPSYCQEQATVTNVELLYILVPVSFGTWNCSFVLSSFSWPVHSRHTTTARHPNSWDCTPTICTGAGFLSLIYDSTCTVHGPYGSRPRWRVCLFSCGMGTVFCSAFKVPLMYTNGICV